MRKVKRLAVLTSGGDAPGMNAGIRAIIRMANYYGLQTFGVRRGYTGLVKNDFILMGPRDVSNIIQQGGTILKTSRCEEFRTQKGLLKAKRSLEMKRIDGLIVIGGNGSYAGAEALSRIWSGQVIGMPGTIDNDLYGTDATIGYDTAVNTALQAIDKIRDTADAHERFFLIEVMGRHSGFISLEVGLSGGAEDILIPETQTTIRQLSQKLKNGEKRGKLSSIVIVSEGDEEGGAIEIAKKLKKESKHHCRVVVLGHLQRGGSPTAQDRRLATELGAYAVECFLKRKSRIAVGRLAGKLMLTPFKKAIKQKKPLDAFLLKILPALAS